MRTKIFAANWKMNKTTGEAVDYITKLIKLAKGIKDCEIVICPPYTALSSIDNLTAATNITIGAQNMFYKDSGAYTGEVSPAMLKDCGCKYVILGHSERREYFRETDEDINLKIKKSLEHKLIPIICVGETYEQRQKGQEEKVVGEQLKKCLSGIKETNFVIAYEPVWAIGREGRLSKPATQEEAQRQHAYIRKVLGGMYGKGTADSIRILYGGSLNPGNAKELLSSPDIDGGLVGGAGLEPETFMKIILYLE